MLNKQIKLKLQSCLGLSGKTHYKNKKHQALSSKSQLKILVFNLLTEAVQAATGSMLKNHITLLLLNVLPVIVNR